MPIITKTEQSGFDCMKISKGYFIRARYHTQEKPYNGLVANVTPDEIRVLYISDIGNVSNFFVIPISEVIDGLWTISISPDMKTVDTDGKDDDT